MGRILKIGSPDDLQSAALEGARILLSGGIVAYPTESFYGLAVDLKNESAIKRLFRVKSRPEDRPILVLIPGVEALVHYVKSIPCLARRLIQDFWPGGLTLVFEAAPHVSTLLTAETGKIGIRYSSNQVASALAQAAGAGISGTSANISGGPACNSAGEVQEAFGDSVDVILDGGETPGREGSTVLDVTVSPPEILREGMVSRDQLKRVTSLSV